MDISKIDGIVASAVADSTDRAGLWVRLVKDLECRTLCEVGVWRGEFAELLLNKIPAIEKYTLIDPWRNLPSWNKPANKSDIEFEAIRAEAMGRVAPHSDKIIEVRDTTKNARSVIPDDSLDFTYIDGDHTLRGITIDLNAMLPKIKAGGFIGGDDFSKSIWQHDTSFTPSEVHPYAIYFAEAYDLRIYTLPFHQFLIINDPSGFEVVDHGGYSTLSPADIYLPPVVPFSLRRVVGKMLPAPLKQALKRVLPN